MLSPPPTHTQCEAVDTFISQRLCIANHRVVHFKDTVLSTITVIKLPEKRYLKAAFGFVVLNVWLSRPSASLF